MSYKIKWSEHNPTIMTVENAIDPNRFRIRGTKFTAEEKAAYNAKKALQTPQENLRDLFIESWHSKWQACPLYDWLEANCPGARGTMGNDNDVIIIFEDKAQAMHFKLAWA